jgi:hypothetical protein
MALCAAPAFAQPPGTAAPTESDVADTRTLEARAHFKAGTKLYRDGNYGGALAEFEEAYRLKPGPGSLQNVALSQKGLFRYAEAAATLEQLLEQHRAELSEEESRAVRDALSELRGLIASVRLRIAPESARVLLDGRLLTSSERAAPIVLNVGEHTLSVDAPGYAPERRVLRIAGGQRELPIAVDLRCVSGFVQVTSNDPSASIAIDGVPMARRSYEGPVEPDVEHLAQVYREGIEPFEQTFAVAACRTLRIEAKLEGLERAVAGVDAAGPPASPPRRSQRGFYGLASLELFALSRQPLDLDSSLATRGGGLGALGLRAGYRPSNPLAFELMFGVGALQVRGAPDPGRPEPRRDYSLRTFHVGPNVSLMTAGEKVRLLATLGAGVVHHRLELEGVGSAPKALARGVDPYLRLEVGVAINYRHFLGQLSLVGLLDGTTALQNGFTDATNRHLTEGTSPTLAMLGVALRGGLSQWRPSR